MRRRVERVSGAARVDGRPVDMSRRVLLGLLGVVLLAALTAAATALGREPHLARAWWRGPTGAERRGVSPAPQRLILGQRRAWWSC